MEIFSLFPSVIHRLDPPSDFKYIKDDLINFVYKERKRDPKADNPVYAGQNTITG